MVVEMLQKSDFLLYVLYSRYIKFYFDYKFHIYVIGFIKYLLYICICQNCYNVRFLLGEGNLIFCCTGSRENFVRSVGRQNNNNNAKFQGRYI